MEGWPARDLLSSFGIGDVWLIIPLGCIWNSGLILTMFSGLRIAFGARYLVPRDS